MMNEDKLFTRENCIKYGLFPQRLQSKAMKQSFFLPLEGKHGFDDDLDRTFANKLRLHEYMRERFPTGDGRVTLDACEACRTGLVPLQ